MHRTQFYVHLYFRVIGAAAAELLIFNAFILSSAACIVLGGRCFLLSIFARIRTIHAVQIFN